MVIKPSTLFVVPPFAGLDRPSLGAHILQSVAQADGFKVDVLYANLILAQLIGEDAYNAISTAPSLELIGERLIGGLIHDELSWSRAETERRALELLLRQLPSKRANELIATFPQVFCKWIDTTFSLASLSKYDVVAFSSTFEQTNATFALSKCVRRLSPEIMIIVGGANCEGAMAESIQRLMPHINYVFSGESEETFLEFLRNLPTHEARGIILGRPNRNLSRLALPDFVQYFEQLEKYLPRLAANKAEYVSLPYESSRGCWWGQKHHCTFCGLNGEGMGFRQKSADQVFGDLVTLKSRHGINKICMTDNIMPHEFFRTLLPKLKEGEFDFNIFYEQKANMSLAKVQLLKSSGVNSIQPGIESLNSSILSRIDKGTTASQNIALLRYARACDVRLSWNLIYGFPGDNSKDYDEMRRLIPWLSHLDPPSGLCVLSIDRFSPYFSQPEKYGVHDIAPHAAYSYAFPNEANLSNLAYHFRADFECEVDKNSEVIQRLYSDIEEWKRAWTSSSTPILSVIPLQADEFMIVDTRASANESFAVISRKHAEAALTRKSARDQFVDWALERRYCLAIDNHFVPLAVASPDLIQEFESNVVRGVSYPRMALQVGAKPRS